MRATHVVPAGSGKFGPIKKIILNSFKLPFLARERGTRRRDNHNIIILNYICESYGFSITIVSNTYLPPPPLILHRLAWFFSSEQSPANFNAC